jgi:hypothetical protein
MQALAGTLPQCASNESKEEAKEVKCRNRRAVDNEYGGKNAGEGIPQH